MSAIIRREVFERAVEGFALPGQQFVVALNEPAVLTDLGRLVCPEPLRYPVMTVGTGRGRCIAGQSQTSLATWEYVEAEGQWHDRGGDSGVRPCVYLPDGTLVIERGGDGHPVDGWAGTGLDGQPVRIVPFDPMRDIHEYTELGPFLIGQSSIDGIELQFDGQRYQVEPGDVHTIWAVLGPDGVLAVATRKLAQNETVLLWLDVNAITELPLAPYRPPIDPPVIVPIDPPIIPPKEPPVSLQLTARQQEIVQKLYEQHPEFFKARGDGEDDERRKGAKLIAQQFRFEFGEEWGWKSNHGNTENDAPSKDAIAHRTGAYTPGSRQDLDMFDLFNGTTREPNNPCFAETENRDQFFVPVEPVNHLGAAPVDPGGDPDPKPDSDLAAQVAKLAADVLAHGSRLSAVERVVDGQGAQLTAGAARDADMANRLAALEKGGTGGGGGTPIPVDLAKQIASELLKLFSKAAA